MMILLLCFLMFSTPSVIIEGEQEKTFFQPENIVLGDRGSFYILAKDQRLFQFDSKGQLIQEFGGKGQGPGQLNLGVSLVWVAQTNRLWVADAGPQKIHIFKNGSFERSIKVDTVGTLFHQDDTIILAPPNPDGDFLVFSPKGDVARRFKTDFVFPDAHYQNLALWRSFEALPLRDGRILLGYIWANKLSVIDTDGQQFRAWDMSDYYKEYRFQEFPQYFSQLGVIENDDGTLWIMTCDHATKSCQGFLRVDYAQKKVIARASSKVGLRKITRLHDGRYALIEAENEIVKIFDAFPF